eukprot:GHVN01075822.1.p1 GENE.GHVN01075822.1~~GHVN01075822.1.p1  ORF type:complete len:113 (+),score=13.53 GHVN01075822.1:525-863(+)
MSAPTTATIEPLRSRYLAAASHNSSSSSHNLISPTIQRQPSKVKPSANSPWPFSPASYLPKSRIKKRSSSASIKPSVLVSRRQSNTPHSLTHTAHSTCSYTLLNSNPRPNGH